MSTMCVTRCMCVMCNVYDVHSHDIVKICMCVKLNQKRDTSSHGYLLVLAFLNT